MNVLKVLDHLAPLPASGPTPPPEVHDVPTHDEGREICKGVAQ